MDGIATNSCPHLNSATARELLSPGEFSEVFHEWIRAQQDDFERSGLWSNGLVSWQAD